jgi:hypothetical protein
MVNSQLPLILRTGSDLVAVSVAYTSCQFITYALQRPNHCVITVLAKPKIIEDPLMLI